MKTKAKRILAAALAVVTVLAGGILSVAIFSGDTDGGDNIPTKRVGDYSDTRVGLTGEKIKLEDPEIAEKQWYEYVEYKEEPNSAMEFSENGITYKIYEPDDYNVQARAMAVRDYDPDEINGSKIDLSVTWADMVPIFESIAAANINIIRSGGILAGLPGIIGQGVESVTIATQLASSGDIIKASKYYSKTDFMGIEGDPDWKGISNKGFYNASSITISIEKSEQVSVQKTKTTSSEYTVGGSSKVSGTAEIGIILAKGTAGIEVGSSASSSLGYGIDYQQGQQAEKSETVSRTFDARTDELVNGVPWKLVEFKADVPFRVIMEQNGEILNDVYITYTLLNGVCRVFANGYIEHWNTGEIVTYDKFFEGFMTTTEIIDAANKKVAANIGG